jgi:hypothetical protein
LSKTKIRRIYRDGIEISTKGQEAQGTNNFNNVFIIGRAGWNRHHSDFNGNLDDLRIYQGKVLSHHEINNIYNNHNKTQYLNKSFNEFALAVNRIGTGHHSYIVNFDEIEFYGSEQKQQNILEKYRHYAMVVNELKGNDTMCEINQMKLYYEAKNGYTTKVPIYIDGAYNNGYYSLYAVSLRNAHNKSKKYINIKYTKQNSAKSSISLLENKSYMYNLADFVKSSQPLQSIDDILYVYNELKQDTVYPARNNRNNGTVVDPGIRKVNDKFYISCPSLPSLPELPPKKDFRLNFVRHVVATQDDKAVPKNLQNIYDVKNILNKLANLRQTKFDDFDCMFQVDVNDDIAATASKDIYNKKLLISSKNDELYSINATISKLVRMNKQVSEYKILYDVDDIVKSFQKNKIFLDKSEVFFNYIRSVFKNTKDEKYYMYIQL